ncbi:MAG: hypothetical protein GX998_09365 [Firmicutes bacterium]|nr:hypothetical protein [Bacillota bacterium]
MEIKLRILIEIFLRMVCANRHKSIRMGEIQVGKSKWVLLAVLLGMMVMMTGCFGPTPKGGIEGFVFAPTDDAVSRGGEPLLVKGLVEVPAGYRPLKDAIVTVKGTFSRDITDGSGHFLLDGITVGHKELTVTHPNYQPYSQEIHVYEGRPTKIDSPGIKLGIGYYLLIGVSNPEHSIYIPGCENGWTAPELQGPARDLDAMEYALTQHDTCVGKYSTRLDDDATVANVLNDIRYLISLMKDNDYLVIYFSGHGIGGEDKWRFDAIVLHDGLLADYELEEALTNSGLDRRKNKVTLIIDACHSGSFADGNIWRLRAPTSKAFMKWGYTVLASSNPNQESEEDLYGTSTYGAFTYHLVRGLVGDGRKADRNSDGAITAQEARLHINEQMIREGRDQRAELWSSGNDTVIFKYR